MTLELLGATENNSGFEPLGLGLKWVGVLHLLYEFGCYTMEMDLN